MAGGNETHFQAGSHRGIDIKTATVMSSAQLAAAEICFCHHKGPVSTSATNLGGVVIGSGNIGTHAFGRLIGELHAILQDRHRKHVAGHAGQPQTEVWVHLGPWLPHLHHLQLQ